MPDPIHYIEDDNLSRAWARAFLEVTENNQGEVTPLMVTISVNPQNLPEDSSIRNIVDSNLQAKGKYLVNTVANTIFPKSYWNPNMPRDQLFNLYMKNLPRIKQAAKHQNQHGLYFERMVAFGDSNINQLEHIIKTFTVKKNHRRSALQAAIFDPSLDHVHNRQRGFPCLQQVAFTPSKSKLTVTGYYATQHLFEKAYGNYLGLYNLGCFIAHEMGLTLEQVICIATVAKRGNNSRKELEPLANDLKSILGI